VFGFFTSNNFFSIVFRSPCPFFDWCLVPSIGVFHQSYFFVPFARILDIETECINWTFLTVVLFLIIVFSRLAFSEIDDQIETTSIHKLFHCLIELLDDTYCEFYLDLAQWRSSDLQVVIDPRFVDVDWIRIVEVIFIDLCWVLFLINRPFYLITKYCHYSFHLHDLWKKIFRTDVLVQVDHISHFIIKHELQWNYLSIRSEVIHYVLFLKKLATANQTSAIELNFIRIRKHFGWKLISTVLAELIRFHIVNK